MASGKGSKAAKRAKTTARKAAPHRAGARKSAARKTASRRGATTKSSVVRRVNKVTRAPKKSTAKIARKAAKKASAGRRKTARSVKKALTPPKPRRDGRPADVNWPALSPYMTVRDGDASIAFYERAFGFRQEGTVMRDAAGKVMHAGMRLGEACIMFAPQGMANEMRAPVDAGGPTSLSLYVYVADVDALAARATASGANVVQQPADQFWGDRIAIVIDPDGYHWTFATNVGEFDASKAPH